MKKILSTLALFLVFCMPVFSAESVFVPDITTEQAKSAVISYIVSHGWSLGNETEHSVNFYKTERTYDHEKYKQDQLVYQKLKEMEAKDEKQLEFNQKHPLWSAIRDTINEPSFNNSYETINLQFYFFENNGVTIKTDTSTKEIKDMMTTVFTGYYSYNIKYNIPLFAKKDITISDTPQTLYADSNSLGINKKITKINDKNVSEYNKASLRNLFENCPQEKIKLETNDGYSTKTYYVLRTFIEPAYKQYL